MLTAVLRRSGGSLIVTIPQAYIEQNKLQGGQAMSVEISGNELRLCPARVRKSLKALLAQTPEGLCRVEDWDQMPDIETEIS